MSAILKAIADNEAVFKTSFELAVKAKASGGGSSGFDPGGGGSFVDSAQQGATRQRYSQMRGWVQAAIHALAMRASSQPIMVGRLKKASESKKKPGKQKDYRRAMPESIKSISVGKDVELEPENELLKWLEHPNNIQHKAQFVYTFVANLCLTGWGYVACGKGKDSFEKEKLDFFSLPTTWVKPKHDKGAFSEFIVQNPDKPGGNDAPPLDRSQVAFAQFPNPANPLGALSLTQAQANAIKIDDNIQSSQVQFFDNAVFPNAIVTIGQNPLGNNMTGVRPRLTGPQRRMVYAAIKKSSVGCCELRQPGHSGRFDREHSKAVE
jgi:hypothetical protein